VLRTLEIQKKIKIIQKDIYRYMIINNNNPTPFKPTLAGPVISL
jgi:hypothetical protein